MTTKEEVIEQIRFINTRLEQYRKELIGVVDSIIDYEDNGFTIHVDICVLHPGPDNRYYDSYGILYGEYKTDGGFGNFKYPNAKCCLEIEDINKYLDDGMICYRLHIFDANNNVLEQDAKDALSNKIGKKFEIFDIGYTGLIFKSTL